MNLDVKSKRPDDVLDYDFDLAQRWLPADDVVVSAISSISGGTAVINDTIVSEGAVRVWVAGGAEGETNIVSVDVTTALGRVKEFCFHLRITRC